MKPRTNWSAAASWEARIKSADQLIEAAESDSRGVALIPLSEPARDITLRAGERDFYKTQFASYGLNFDLIAARYRQSAQAATLAV